ncbi:DUF5329 family protein [Haliea sp. E17]|uniref:DUF5329 family protein n=1 Tax=Haliea sp. E17 TaxID=3401576 RepID=UPI003AAAA026
MMRYLIPGLLALSLAALAQGAGTSAREIDYLIAFVGGSGCTFHRNGSDYPASEAADHLQLKYRRGARYADTAEHFIDRLASESSWSGKPYTVTCAGKTESSRAWLHRALDSYRQTGS